MDSRVCCHCYKAFSKRPKEGLAQWSQRRFCSHACRDLHLIDKAAVEVVSRFWSKVDRRGPDDCWPWKANRYTNGYGQFWLRPRQEGAHRVAFKLTHGRWPQPECLHKCDNPPCCNPAHLWEGTKSDNVRDCIAKGRHRYVKPIRWKRPAA